MADLVLPPPGGPRPVGILAAVATGAWTDIVSIVAPSSAKYGDLVNVEVKVKNLATYGIYIAVTGRYEVVDAHFSPDYATVEAGATYSFTSSFSMPNNSITIYIWSWYWTAPNWIQDDYGSIGITLAVPEAPETYTGKISKKELEYDGARANIPADDIPQGKRGLVHIWGRNNMTTTQCMGVHWIVFGPPGWPDGPKLEEYSDWEAWPYTGPGKEHEFIGGRFNLDEVGLYGISCGLLMNPDAPVYVDIYYGDLCTVAAVIPTPEFADFGISEYTIR